jgi:hypothetical protein
MTAFRLLVLAATLMSVGGAVYLGYSGVWRESSGLDTSIRTGSAGNGLSNARVK